MANEFYTPTGAPASSSQGSSATIRSEFDDIEDGLDKLPTMASNGDEAIFVNTAANALEAVPAVTARTRLGIDALINGQRHNGIIAGNFDLLQRTGTPFTADGYGLDRWRNNRVGTTFSTTQSSHTLGQTDVPGEPQFFHTTVVTSVANAANYFRVSQRIEGVRKYAGQTVMLSFYAKADATKNIATEFVQNFGTGGSPSSEVTATGVTTHALTSSWQKFTISVAIPSISGKTLGSTVNNYIELNFWMDAGSNFNARTSTLGQQSGTFDISQVQVEKGAVATVFEEQDIGQIQTDCERYYETGVLLFNGDVTNTGQYRGYINFHTKKRGGVTAVVVHSAANLFPASVGSVTADRDQITELRSASSTGAAGLFTSSYTAASEL